MGLRDYVWLHASPQANLQSICATLGTTFKAVANRPALEGYMVLVKLVVSWSLYSLDRSIFSKSRLPEPTFNSWNDIRFKAAARWENLRIFCTRRISVCSLYVVVSRKKAAWRWSLRYWKCSAPKRQMYRQWLLVHPVCCHVFWHA